MSGGFTIPMFPLSTVVFPHQKIPLHVFEPRYQRLVDDINAREGRFGICLIARGSEVGGGDERVSTGTLMQLENVVPFNDGRFMIVASGIERVVVEEWLSDEPYPQARVRLRPGFDVPIDPEILRTTEQAVRSLRSLQSEMDADSAMVHNCEMASALGVRAWQLCSMAPMATLDQLKLLTEDCCDERLRLLAEICCERYGDFRRQLFIDHRGFELGDSE
ncbi:MAG: LON peptidase substrate-binding domain-containing protein [Actinomycetota bacterium]